MKYSSALSVTEILDGLRLLSGFLIRSDNIIDWKGASFDRESRHLKTVLETFVSDANRGMPLQYSLKKAGFPADVCCLLALAEQKGELKSAITRLTACYKSRLGLQNICIRALYYPLLVINILLFLLAFVAIYVGPVISIYQDMATNTTILWLIFLIWKIMYTLSPIIFLLAAGLAAVLVLFGLGYKRPLYRLFESIFLYVPWYGNVLRYEAAAHLVWTLSISLESGQDLTAGLNRLKKEHSSIHLTKIARNLQEHISKGLPIATPLKEAAFLPLSLRLVLLGGVESGELLESLKAASGLAEAEIPTLLADSERMLSLLFLLISGVITAGGLVLIFYPLGSLI